MRIVHCRWRQQMQQSNILTSVNAKFCSDIQERSEQTPSAEEAQVLWCAEGTPNYLLWLCGVCWSSSISAAGSRWLDTLIKRASSILGCPLDPVQVVGKSRVITAGAGVPAPAGHYHSTGQLLQQPTDTVQVCEGEVSQVLPYCCCQTFYKYPYLLLL